MQSDKNIQTSGGGFSAYYDQPAYQKAAVAGYLAAVKGTAKDPVAGFDASKRAYPDVSLAGAKYSIYVGGKVIDLYGTGAATPAVAAFFSNINAARLAAGKGSLGWANQALYTNPSAFVNDITSGDNLCGAENSQGKATCCAEGFYVATGWDPTTGLGSLDYAKLAAALTDTKSVPSSQPLLQPASSPLRPTPPQPSGQSPTQPQPSPVTPRQPQPSPVAPRQPQPSPVAPTQPQPSPLRPTPPQPSAKDPTPPQPSGQGPFPTQSSRKAPSRKAATTRSDASRSSFGKYKS